jgi:2',3'-cyclic-nucleotide 2'-phosphodiesterase
VGSRKFKVLALGDIIGAAGQRAVVAACAGLKRRHNADMVIVNGENAVEGFGIDEATAQRLFAAGADVITTGNHVWQQKSAMSYLDREERILRPANYPGGNPGHGYCVVDVRGETVVVLNVQGRVRMPSIDCPFRTAKDIVRKLKGKAKIFIVDFHAEATEEKEALAAYLDGEVTLVFGTHTHVQTTDERILPGGTSFLTDIGACGPHDSVIGFKSDVSVRRALTQLPLKNEVSDTTARLHGLVLSIDPLTGKTVNIERIQEDSLV